MILALLLSCSPTPSGASLADCDSAELAAGQVRVCRLASGDAPDGSDGRTGDWRLQNALLDVIVRDDYAPLTLLDGAGGTLVAAVVPGASDPILELIPTLPGGWFHQVRIDGVQADDQAALVLEGIDGSGAQARLELRMQPDQPWVELSGAQGWTLVAEAGAERVGDTVERDGVVVTGLAGEGEVDDLGGALRWTAGQRLVVAERRAAYAARWGEGVPVSGTAAEAEWVEARAGGQTLARLPVEDGAFAGESPPGTEALVAVAAGRAESPAVSPGEGVDLVLGGAGRLHVRVADETGAGIWALVEREGESHPVPPEGATLELAPGTSETVVWAGPGYEAAWPGPVEVGEDSRLDVVLPRVWRGVEAPVLAELGLLAWPDASVREPTAPRLTQAAGRGVRYAVVVAEDEVAHDVSQDARTVPHLAVRAGSLAATDTMGRPMAWPWSASSILWAHGAARWRLVDAWDLLSVMEVRGARNVLLDLDWFDAAGTAPEGFVDALGLRLDGIGDLPGYLALLDRGERLPAMGAWTWVEDVDQDRFSAQEVERALWEGRTLATSGPVIHLRVEGAGPGQVAHPVPEALWRPGEGASPGQGEPPLTLSVDLQVATPAWAPLDEVALYGPDGVELARLPALRDGRLAVDAHLVLPPVEWVVAAAWGSEVSALTGEPAWAVTAPVQVQLP